MEHLQKTQELTKNDREIKMITCIIRRGMRRRRGRRGGRLRRGLKPIVN
jgi:hypothetical protein